MRCFCSLAVVLGALPLLAAEANTEATRQLTTIRADASGKLVRRTVVVQPRVISSAVLSGAREEKPVPAALAADASVNEIIEHAAERHKVDPLLVHSVIQVESAYNKYAVSPKGAMGMMQLMPATARSLGVRNPFDPRENIEAGVKYLKQLQDTFGDLRHALAAYNAGPGAVSRYGTIPPYAETQNYVYQVGKRLGNARRVQREQVSVKTVELPKRIERTVDEAGTVHLRMR
ncbi:MAG: lytic transglycosylase domain-containing protein [Bryobacterales bacterium]|nr:lytic transglycosylase domain-containing protein [Bryobacterales bacterium]